MTTIIFPTYIKIYILPSLTILNPKTNTNGAIALKGLRVDKTGIHCMIAMHKKYTFA